MKRFWAFYIPYFIFIIVLSILIIANEKAELHLWLSTPHTALGDLFFKHFTDAGGSLPFIVAGVLLFYKYRTALFILASQILVTLITQPAKQIFNMPRPKTFFAANFPDVALPMVEGVRVHSWKSFPSGHSATVFAFFFCVALMTKNKTLQFVCFVAAVTGAYSRIYLHQHFASDVLAGTIIGGFATTLCYVFVFNKYNMTWANGSLMNLIKKRK